MDKHGLHCSTHEARFFTCHVMYAVCVMSTETNVRRRGGGAHDDYVILHPHF